MPESSDESTPFIPGLKVNYHLDTPNTNDTLKAIDVESCLKNIQIIEDYVTHSRGDFLRVQDPVWTNEKMTQFLYDIQETAAALRDIKISKTDSLHKWRDPSTEERVNIFLRITDPKIFDTLVALYERTNNEFNTYFQTHVDMIRKHKI